MTRRSPFASVLEAWGDPLGPRGLRRLGTALFLGLVAFVAFYDLGSRSLHTLDLPRFGVLAREMIRTGEWLVPTRYGEIYANKPPLPIWMVAAPSALAGEVTPFLVRWPSALGLVLLALTASAWGRLRGGSGAAGRAAGLLLLGTYAITRFGREGRPDLLASGLVVAATYFLDRAALGRGRRRDPWVAGLLLGLALLAKGPVLLLFPALVLLLPSAGRSTAMRLRAGRPHVAFGTAIALAMLWFVPATAQGGGDYAHALLVKQAADRLEGVSTHVEPLTYYLLRFLDGGAPWTPLYLATAVLAFVGRRRLGNARSLVGAALIAIAVFSLFPTKHIRYVLPVFALLAIGAGAVAAGALPRPARRRLWMPLYRGGALILGLVSVGLLAVAAGGLAPAWMPASAFLPLLGPGLLLLGLAGAAFVPREIRPGEVERRRLAGALLVGVALAFVAYWAVRDRYRVRPREAFDRAVAAALVPGVPVLTLTPVEPGHVFHGAPDARLVRHVPDIPGPDRQPRLVVLAEETRRAEVEQARGAPADVLLSAPMGDNWPTVLLLGFEAR